MADKSDGQPSIETLTSEGVSIRKCIASGEEYGGGSAPAPKASGSAKPQQGSLAGMRMKGKGY